MTLPPTTELTVETGLHWAAHTLEDATLLLIAYAGDEQDIPVARLRCNWTRGVWWPRQDSQCTPELIRLVLSVQGME